MQKFCVIYNMAAKYRAPIFQLMDNEMDVDWYYGKPIGNIRELDPKILKHVTKLKRLTFGPLIWQKGVVKLLNVPEYKQYLILGEPFTISTWMLLILRPFIASKKKIYFWSHGWYGRENFFKKWLKLVFFGLGDGTFLYGNYAKNIAINQGNNADKLYVIHNSLDHSNHLKLRKSLTNSNTYVTFFKNNYPTLIFIGRLTPVKQLDLVINAVKTLSDKGEYYNLILVGDGSEREKLSQLASSLNINIWFYGECYEDNRTAQLIYDSDLCVSPGNVGLTAIHTMSFGTPVITHSNFANQMPEFEAIKAGITGDFFNENDIVDLADKISLWFKNHTDREKVRKDCYKEIDTFWTPKYQLEILKKYMQ